MLNQVRFFGRSQICVILYMHSLFYFKVIGDKKGGTTSMFLANPKNMELLEKIGQIVQIPMKFIHVTRNPFDNIATIMLRRTSSRQKVRAEGAEKVKWLLFYLFIYLLLFFALAMILNAFLRCNLE